MCPGGPAAIGPSAISASLRTLRERISLRALSTTHHTGTVTLISVITPCRALITSLAIAFVATLFLSAQQSPTSDLETTAFVCPMHPDYTLDIAGTCPRCGMALVRATPYDVRDYGFEFTTVPAIVRAGEPAQWRFSIFHPGTGQRVTKFESVHERQYHLFVISQDMQHFQHIHPVEQPDGTWTIDVTLPKAGYYKVLSDFLPSGGA